MLTDLLTPDMAVVERIVRTTGVYVALLIIIRVFGKRLMAQMNSLDLVVVLLLSNMVQNAMIGTDLSLTGAVIGAVVLALVSWFLDVLAHKFKTVDTLLAGTPTVVVSDGHADEAALRRLSISHHELSVALRRQGANQISEVSQAYIEPGGQVRVDLNRQDRTVSSHELEGAIAALQRHLDERLDALEQRT